MSEENAPLEFVVETWAPEFGSSVQSLDLEKALEPANLEVEFPLKDWKPINPKIIAEGLTNGLLHLRPILLKLLGLTIFQIFAVLNSFEGFRIL